MTLRQLTAFKAVIDGGSFSEAALERGISQASISQSIQELELNLGLKLFKRGHFGARLTLEGKKLEPYVRRMLQLRDAMFSEAKLMAGSVAGKVRVATFQSVSKDLLPELMVHLMLLYPELQVDVIESFGDAFDTTQMILDGRADVGFASRDVSASLLCWKLMSGSFLVLAPESYKVNTLADLADLPLITYDGYEKDNCTAGNRYFQQSISHTKAAYRVKETSTILGMIAKGLGFSILPSFVTDYFPTGIKSLAFEMPFNWTIYIAVAPDMLKTPVVRALLIALKERFPDSAIPDFQLRPLLNLQKP